MLRIGGRSGYLWRGRRRGQIAPQGVQGVAPIDVRDRAASGEIGHCGPDPQRPEKGRPRRGNQVPRKEDCGPSAPLTSDAARPEHRDEFCVLSDHTRPRPGRPAAVPTSPPDAEDASGIGAWATRANESGLPAPFGTLVSIVSIVSIETRVPMVASVEPGKGVPPSLAPIVRMETAALTIYAVCHSRACDPALSATALGAGSVFSPDRYLCSTLSKLKQT
jgi:hypothetical protein